MKKIINIFEHAVANKVADQISNAEGFPFFIHKWSKQRRQYKLNELLLPDKVEMLGRLKAIPEFLIGIGGTRSPSVETFLQVSAICESLSEHGVCLISGGVPGVDLACHLAGATGKGGTVAVLANPVDAGFEGNGLNCPLLDDAIRKNGAFISEYSQPESVDGDIFRERLLQRDRIISGLSGVFVAFECNEDSATVDTALRALLQGKKVFVVHPPIVRDRIGTLQLSKNPFVSVIDGRSMEAGAIANVLISALYL